MHNLLRIIWNNILVSRKVKPVKTYVNENKKGYETVMKKSKMATASLLLLGVILATFPIWGGKKIEKEEEYSDGYRKDIVIKDKKNKNKNKNKESVDVLVIGDSESYTSVSPVQLWEEQGITAYVCGQPGQKIQNTYRMLLTALQFQSPKVVLLETNLMFRQPGPVANVLSVKTKRLKSSDKMLRYHTFWKTIHRGKKSGEACYKGFVLRGGVSPFQSGDYMKKTKDVQKIPDMVLEYMEAIRMVCSKKGINLVLISAPSPKNYNFKKHNAIKKYADKKGLPYVDLNLLGRELGMNWKTDSYDKGDHLNLNGARKVTFWIGKYLRKNYDLTDHRGKLEYKSWDKEILKYKESIKELKL